MPSLLRMPEVAANATHAVLAAWSVAKGQAFSAGDTLAEVETDKAMVDLPAEVEGFLVRQLVTAGSRVEVGAPIAVLSQQAESDGDIDAFMAAALRDASDDERTAMPRDEAAEKPHPDAQKVPRRVFASPVARKLAASQGVDLTSIRGSGPNGRIVKDDVLAQLKTRVPEPATRPVLHTSEQKGAAVANYVEVAHTGMRQAIARRLTESKATTPHFYLTAECRVDHLLELRAELNLGGRRKITVNDFVIRAVAEALKRVPDANVAWTDKSMRRFTCSDIAVAVAVQGGLITPIVRSAESKSLSAISAEIVELATRAKAGKLRSEEFEGGCFTVSNLGTHGVQQFNAIINPPHAGILAVGAIRDAPAVVDSQVVVARVMTCTLSVDHRAIDGAVAAAWLAAFKQLIENPLEVLA